MGGCQASRVVERRAYNRHDSVISSESINSVENINSVINVKGITQLFDDIIRDIHSDKLKLWDFRVRLTENHIQLHQILEPSLINHELILLLKKTLTTVLMKWNSSEIQSFDETDKLTFRNVAIFFSGIAEHFNTHTSFIVYQSFLSNMPFIEVMQQCLEAMISNGKHLTDEYNLESFAYLLDIFRNFETQSSHSVDEIQSILKLLTSVSDLIRSKYYTETFLRLLHDASEFSVLQRFILDKCPSFLNAYKGKHSFEIHDTLLEQIFDQYVQILEHFLPHIESWTTPVISAITHIIDIMVNASVTTQTHIFQQPNIIDYGLAILRSQRLYSKLQSRCMDPETWLINSILTGFHNMIYDLKLLAILKRKTVTPIFMKITSIAYYDRIQIHAYLILAGILSEAEIQELNNAKEITMVFLKYLTKASKSHDKMFKGVTMGAILCGLKALVQHDDIKDAILTQDRDLQLLSTIVFQTTDQELAHALSILWTLSFNKKVASVILNSIELMNRIRILADATKHGEQKDQNKKDDTNNDKSLEEQNITSGHSSKGLFKSSQREHIKITNVISSAAEGILWQVQNEATFIENQPKANSIAHAPMHLSHTEIHSTDLSTKKKYDVMISYSHDDRVLCHKIADNLVNDGFNVWIDKNDITGSTPAAIADGIENSEIVLLGMTYSYKVSPWCQRESNYAFQRQTKIIPFKLPPAYTADGWLGLLVASLTYINFSKLEFNVAYEQLKTEIMKYKNQAANIPQIQSSRKERCISPPIKVMNEPNGKKSLNEDEYLYPPQSDGLYNKISIQSWTNQNVIDFFNDKKLHPLILLCNDMDGSALHQLYKFCDENSTVAFESLQKQLNKKFGDYNLSPIEYTRFISEIKKLNLIGSNQPPERSRLCIIM